jgi:Zn-finger nucleic acid-binding protein
VWLDRGELDKIIDRAAQLTAPAAVAPSGVTSAPAPPPPRYDRGHDRSRDRDDDWDDSYRGPRKKKKRGSFLEDMFDFG